MFIGIFLWFINQTANVYSSEIRLEGKTGYTLDERVDIGLVVNPDYYHDPKTLYLYFESDNPQFVACSNKYITVDGCYEDPAPVVSELFPVEYLNLPCGEAPCLLSFPASELGEGVYTLKAGIGGLQDIEQISWSEPLTFSIAMNINCQDPQYAQEHPDICGSTGNLAFRIFWDDVNDIDIHVITPQGKEIYFGNREDPGSTGKLDIDANAGCRNVKPQGNNENIFFTEPPSGDYMLKVKGYRQCLGGPSMSNVRVQIIREGNIVYEGQITVNVEQTQMVEVTTYTY